nr:MAG TPA: hypothetical protein [Caudoviricetes sp.]
MWKLLQPLIMICKIFVDFTQSRESEKKQRLL